MKKLVACAAAVLAAPALLAGNLCTGGENYHGRFEFIPVEDMELCVEMILHILRGEN